MYDIELILQTWTQSASENDWRGHVTLPCHEVKVVLDEIARLRAVETEGTIRE